MDNRGKGGWEGYIGEEADAADATLEQALEPPRDAGCQLLVELLLFGRQRLAILRRRQGGGVVEVALHNWCARVCKWNAIGTWEHEWLHMTHMAAMTHFMFKMLERHLMSLRHLYFTLCETFSFHVSVHHVTMKNYFSFVADLKQLRVIQEANNHFEILFLWPWGEGTRVLQGHIGHINDLIKKQLEQPQFTTAFQITINNPVSTNLLRLKHSMTQLLRDVSAFITPAVCLTQLGTYVTRLSVSRVVWYLRNSRTILKVGAFEESLFLVGVRGSTKIHDVVSGRLHNVLIIWHL